MSLSAEAAVLRELRRIPGVGKEVSRDLYELGFRSVGELAGQDPRTLYEEHCLQKGMRVDRCMLYVFRCAVYFASTAEHDPDLLHWWNWKDRQR